MAKLQFTADVYPGTYGYAHLHIWVFPEWKGDFSFDSHVTRTGLHLKWQISTDSDDKQPYAGEAQIAARDFEHLSDITWVARRVLKDQYYYYFNEEFLTHLRSKAEQVLFDKRTDSLVMSPADVPGKDVLSWRDDHEAYGGKSCHFWVAARDVEEAQRKIADRFFKEGQSHTYRRDQILKDMADWIKADQPVRLNDWVTAPEWVDLDDLLPQPVEEEVEEEITLGDMAEA